MSYWLSTPLVPSGTIVSVCAGHFRNPSAVDIILNKGEELHVLSFSPAGKLVTLFKQPVLCHVRDLKVLPLSSSKCASDRSSGSSTELLLDHLAALLRTGSLAVLRFHHQLNRFIVITELTLAAGSDLARDHLGCRLAVSPDGSSIALAAARGRIACVNVTAAAAAATSGGVQLSEPVVYAAAAPRVAGAIDLDRSVVNGQHLELGKILDLTFFSGTCSDDACGSSKRPVHLAAISYRPGEASSELVLLQWNPEQQQQQQQALIKLGVVVLPHRGPEGRVGRPLHLTAVPSSPTGVVIIGTKSLLVLDCSQLLHAQRPDVLPTVAATVGLFDLHLIHEPQLTTQSPLQQRMQQQQQQLEFPCWLGKCLASVGATAARRRPSAAAAAAVREGDEDVWPSGATSLSPAAAAARDDGSPDVYQQEQQDEVPNAGRAAAAAAAEENETAAAAPGDDEDIFPSDDDDPYQAGTDVHDDLPDQEDYELQQEESEEELPGYVPSEDDDYADFDSEGSSDREAAAAAGSGSSSESGMHPEHASMTEDDKDGPALVTAWTWHTIPSAGSSSSSLMGPPAAAVAADANGAAAVPLQPAIDCLVLGTPSGLIRLGLRVGPDSLAATQRSSPYDPPAMAILGEQSLQAGCAVSSTAAVQSADLLLALPGQQLLAVHDSSSTALLLQPSSSTQRHQAVEAAGQQTQPPAAAAAAAAKLFRAASPALRQLGHLKLESHSNGTPGATSDVDMDSPHSLDEPAAAAAAAGDAGGPRSHRLDAISPQDDSSASGAAAAAASGAAAAVQHAASVALWECATTKALDQATQRHQQQQQQNNDDDSLQKFKTLPDSYSVTDQIELLGPIGKCAVVQCTSSCGSSGSSPLLVAANRKASKGLRVLTPGTPADVLFAGPEGMLLGVTNMWPLGSLPDGTGYVTTVTDDVITHRHQVLVFSFADATRALSVGARFADVSDALGLIQNQPTLLAACVAENVTVQVTPIGVQLLDCFDDGPIELSEDWLSGCSSTRPWRSSPKSSRLSELAPLQPSQQQQQVLDLLGRVSSSSTSDSSLGGVQLPAVEAGVAAAAAGDAGTADSVMWQQQQQYYVPSCQKADLEPVYWTVQEYITQQQRQQQSDHLIAAAAAGVDAAQDTQRMLGDPCMAASAATGDGMEQQQQQAVAVLAAAAPGAVAVYLSTGELVVLQVSCQQQQARPWQQQQDDLHQTAAAATGSKKRGRSSWGIAVLGSLMLHKHVSCLQMCTVPAATTAAAGPSSSSSSSRYFSYCIIIGSYTGSLQLFAVHTPNKSSSSVGCSTSSSSVIDTLATFTAEQLHPLRLLSKLTGDRNSRTAANPAAANLVSPAVPDSCLVIPDGGLTTSPAQGQYSPARSACQVSSAGGTRLLLLVSYRNGDVALYSIDMSLLLVQQQQQQHVISTAAVPLLRVLSSLRLSGAPAKLQLLPPACAAAASSSSSAEQQLSSCEDHLVLAVSDGMWLLQISHQAHQIQLRHIATPPSVLAAALQLPAAVLQQSGSSSSTERQQQQQCSSHCVACVQENGQLQLLSLPPLQRHQQHRQQHWLQGINVTELVVHPGSQKLLALCNSPQTNVITPYMPQQQERQQSTWLQCLDPESGAKLAAYNASTDHSIACMGFWQVAQDVFSSSSGSSSSSPEQAVQPGSSTTGGRNVGATADSALYLAELFQDLDSPSAGRFRRHLKTGLSGSGTSGHQSWRRMGPLVILGTRSFETTASTDRDEDDNVCKGQVLVLQLMKSQGACASLQQQQQQQLSAGSSQAAAAAEGTSTEAGRIPYCQQLQQLQKPGTNTPLTTAAVATMQHSSASCYMFQRVARLRMPQPVSAVCGFTSELLLVALDNVLAVYKLQRERKWALKQAAYCFTRAPIVSLSPGEAGSGLVFASDMLQGVTVYQIDVHAVTGQVAIQAVAAHTDVRPIMQVTCLPPFPGPKPGVAAAAAAADLSCGAGSGSSSISAAAVDRAAAVARCHALCLDSRGYVTEVSWAKQRVMPVKSLATIACMPVGGAAAAMQVAAAGADHTGQVGSSGNADWLCRSVYGLLDNEDIQLHWQHPLAAATSSNLQDLSSGAAGRHAAAGVAASSAIVAAQSGAVLHLQKLPAPEGQLLLHLQQRLLQHPLTTAMCIGGEHVVRDEEPSGPAQPPVRLGVIDSRVLHMLLLLPGQLQLLLLQSAGLSRVLSGRLGRALEVPEWQQNVLDAVLCRLQVLPCWE